MKTLCSLLLALSLPAMAQDYKTNCSSSRCDTFQRIRGAAAGLYLIGQDNNHVSSAFLSKTKLSSLTREILPSFFPYKDAKVGDDDKRKAAVKECVFMIKGAYGEHLPTYQATRISFPGSDGEILDFQNIAAEAFLRILQQTEAVLQQADPSSRVQYSKITYIPEDFSFPANDEIFAAPCAFAIEWSNGMTSSPQALILRSGVTD